jgi:hypothetical protein
MFVFLRANMRGSIPARYHKRIFNSDPHMGVSCCCVRIYMSKFTTLQRIKNCEALYMVCDFEARFRKTPKNGY